MLRIFLILLVGGFLAGCVTPPPPPSCDDQGPGWRAINTEADLPASARQSSAEGDSNEQE